MNTNMATSTNGFHVKNGNLPREEKDLEDSMEDIQEYDPDKIAQDFAEKYPIKDIWHVLVDAPQETIFVHTANAKIWVDIPEYFKEFYVQMVVGRDRRSRQEVGTPATFSVIDPPPSVPSEASRSAKKPQRTWKKRI